jgi:predicted Fe-Mo cluster-binding NifX family protein
MMKVAIPVFLDRVSPRLDCARKLLILDIEKDRLVDKRELDISQWAPDEKIIFLKEMGIDQLICGGLRLQDRSGLHHFGIQVASPLYGEVETIIREYLNGKLTVPCCRAQIRRGRRGRCI